MKLVRITWTLVQNDRAHTITRDDARTLLRELSRDLGHRPARAKRTFQVVGAPISIAVRATAEPLTTEDAFALIARERARCLAAIEKGMVGARHEEFSALVDAWERVAGREYV